jgi:plastocyanin
MFRTNALIAALVAALSLTSCGEIETDPATNGVQSIVIQNGSFSPISLPAAAGETVFFYNADIDPHRVLSQSDNDAFDDTGVFDTSVITEGGFGAVTVPETARSGDEIPYYDAYFRETMTTPNGVVVVK